jgi:hypothetical protein
MKRLFLTGVLVVLILGVSFAGAIQAQTIISQLDSQCVGSIKIPSRVYAGEDFDATVRVRNTGTTRWRRSDGFKLGSPNLQYNMTTWGVGSVAIPVYEGSVPRNDSVRFQFDPIAPATPGTYTFSWQMLQGSQLFGQVCTRNIEVQLRPNDADSISITGIPNRVETGQQFIAHITMKNNSRRTWTVGEYRLGSNGLMPSNTTVEGPLRAYLHDPVPRNGRATFDLVVTAPATVTGNSQQLTLRWRMLQENVEWFGQAGSRRIRVYKSATPVQIVTPTPTPSITSTPGTSTPTATPTQTPTQSIPDVVTKLDCFAPHDTVTPNENLFRAVLSAQPGGVLSNMEITWSGAPFLVSPVQSFTSTLGNASTNLIIPWDLGIHGTSTVRALFNETTVGGVHYLPSSCTVDFSYNSPQLPPPPPYDPTISPTQTPTSTYVPNPYDGQTITPSPSAYDPVTITPNPYDGVVLTASIISPVANTSIAEGQNVPVTVSGTGSLSCGTWTLTKPNGETVTLAGADFVSGQLPGNLPACVTTTY